MNLITDYPVHYSPEEYKRLKAENRNKVLRRDALRRLEALRPAATPKTPYPFCRSIDRCAGLSYCPLDPTCAD